MKTVTIPLTAETGIVTSVKRITKDAKRPKIPSLSGSNGFRRRSWTVSC